MNIGRVGSKGEIFIPKKVRDRLKLKPHTKFIYRIEGNKLIIEPIPTLEEILREKPVLEITLEEFYRFRRRLSRRAES